MDDGYGARSARVNRLPRDRHDRRPSDIRNREQYDARGRRPERWQCQCPVKPGGRECPNSSQGSSGGRVMRGRILIVVDDPAEPRLLAQMVRQFGYEPAVAASGEAALAALTGTNGTRIDAGVLDLITPDLDGVGVLAKMCAGGRAI